MHEATFAGIFDVVKSDLHRTVQARLNEDRLTAAHLTKNDTAKPFMKKPGSIRIKINDADSVRLAHRAIMSVVVPVIDEANREHYIAVAHNAIKLDACTTLVEQLANSAKMLHLNDDAATKYGEAIVNLGEARKERDRLASIAIWRLDTSIRGLESLTEKAIFNV
jgi:hypothetical protein